MKKIIYSLGIFLFPFFVISQSNNCSSISFEQGDINYGGGAVQINQDFSQLDNFSKYVRFKIDEDISNPEWGMSIFQTPNALIYYKPSTQRIHLNIVTNRIGCNSDSGCSQTINYSFSEGISIGEWHSIAFSVDSNNNLIVIVDGDNINLDNPTTDGCCSGNYNYL